MEPPLPPINLDRGDAAAAALGYAAGFAVDVFLFPLGVSPGTTAGVFATGAVGLKNAIDHWLNSKGKGRKALENRFKLLIAFISESKKNNEGRRQLIADLYDEHRLWRDGILTNKQFEEFLNEQVKKYRTMREAVEVNI